VGIGEDDRRAAEAMAVFETERGAKESERVARWWDARKASDESWKGKFMEAMMEAMFIVQQQQADSRHSAIEQLEFVENLLNSDTQILFIFSLLKISSHSQNIFYFYLIIYYSIFCCQNH